MSGSTTICRGNIFESILLKATLTPVAVAANSTVEQNFTVTGLRITDTVDLFYCQSAYTVNVVAVNIRISAANTLTVAYCNPTASPVTPPAGVYLVKMVRPETPDALNANLA